MPHWVRPLAYTAEPYTPGLGYLVSPNTALADPAKAALIADGVADRLHGFR